MLAKSKSGEESKPSSSVAIREELAMRQGFAPSESRRLRTNKTTVTKFSKMEETAKAKEGNLAEPEGMSVKETTLEEAPAKLLSKATDDAGKLDKIKLAKMVNGLVRVGCVDTFDSISAVKAVREVEECAKTRKCIPEGSDDLVSQGVSQATRATVVSPCKKAKVTNPYQKTEVCHTGKGFSVGGLERGKCSMKCPDCEREWGLEKMLRKFVCPNKSCNGEIQDFFRSDMCEVINGVPGSTKEQADCFKAVGTVAYKAFDLLGKKKYPTPETMTELWKIKHIGVAGGLLPDDCFQSVAKHSALKDAMANCIIAIERQDKIGFRAHYATVMYYMMVGYSHVAAIR